MLPALPVEEISTREADTAGAAKGEASPSGGAERAPAKPAKKAPAKKAPAKKAPARKAPSGKAPASKAPAKRSAAKPVKSTAAKSAESAAETTGRPAAVKSTAAGTAPAKAAKLPVREGEERWSERELAEVRSNLAAEIAALSEEITTSATQIAEGDATDGAGDDQADAGAKTYEREHELALTNNSRDLLAQNERALERIDTGTYGICESCGKPIGKGRLQAFPRATLCVACKQREERR